MAVNAPKETATELRVKADESLWSKCYTEPSASCIEVVVTVENHRPYEAAMTAC